jgi:long-subunit fatty acid transport protein
MGAHRRHSLQEAHGVRPARARCLRADLLRWVGSVVLGVVVASPGRGQVVNTGTSLNPVGSGARAMGQGNAFIAVADDATAASWNPAGLSQLERAEVSLALEYYRSRGELESALHPESETAHGTALADLNYASVVYPWFVGGRNLALSLNYLKLYRLDQELAFPVDFSAEGLEMKTGYSMTQHGDLSVLAPAFALDVTDRLALGITVNVWNDDVTQASSFEKTQHNTWTMSMDGYTGAGRAVWEDEYSVDAGYSVVLGALYRLSRAWTLGLVAKPPFTLDLDHTAKVSMAQSGDLGEIPLTAATTETAAELHLPWVLGGGVAWRPNDPLTVTLDVTWTDWSEYSMDEGGTEVNPLNNMPIGTDRCDDAVTVRCGAEYVLQFTRCLVPLRCGVGYDPAPAIGAVDDFYTASVGGGIQWGRYALDLAYQLRWGNEVNTGMLTGMGSEDVLEHRVLLSLIVYL